MLSRGSAPNPGSVACGDPGTPRRFLAGAPCAPLGEWGFVPNPGSGNPSFR